MPQYQIDADELWIGSNVVIEDGVKICGKSRRQARAVFIGDNTFVGRDTHGAVDDLWIGDYVTIHNSCLIAGEGRCAIGHCTWIGEHTILNSTGGLSLGNGVGVGAYSQLWTHIHHGDVLQGCRWNSTKEMVIGDDVWFVGHCIVSPIVAAPRSMALAGSVVTRDMQANHVYAGVPATDITDKVGPQFGETSIEDRLAIMIEKRSAFLRLHPTISESSIAVVRDLSDVRGTLREETTYFDVTNRTYTKRLSHAEQSFMRFLLHGIKFFPLTR